MNRWLLSLVLLTLAAGSLMAAEIGNLPNQYLILKPKAPVVIDGKLFEWDIARSLITISTDGKNPLNSVHINDPTNPPKGDADISGRAALAWDETYLYVAGLMVDDSLMGVKPDSAGNQGPAGWFCDALMVRVASFRQPMKTNTPYDAFPFLALRYAPTGAHPRGTLLANDRGILDTRDMYWKLTEHSKWACSDTPNGYVVEAAIPWKDLNFTARPGEKLFISFLAADNDPGETLIQVGWGFSGDTKTDPVFRLANREDMLGLLTVSADEVPTNQAWAARVEIDAPGKPVKLEVIRVVDGQGKVLTEKSVALLVPGKKSGTNLQEFAAGAISKPGRYMVEALAAPEGGARAVVAQYPITVVEPKPQAPVIQNSSGEILHMGADRMAHNAYMEHREGFYKHNFVSGKNDYVPYIRTHVEPILKSGATTAITQKSPYGYGSAIRCLALYKITGDEEYVKLARDIIDYTLDSGDLGWFKLTSVAMYRHFTWMKDPNSPFAPKDAEKRYRANFYKVAAKPTSDLFAEWGTHNRVWHRYSLLKIARMVAEQDGKPVDPKVIEYTDYHDKLIGDVGDSDDASAGYHWVFFDAALAIYFHTGNWEEFRNHKGYNRTLARYVEMVSPSGACPQFGSCSGWPEVGQSMFAYEWMSTQTRDGRYRWTSHRIAEYYYNHLDYRANQYHGPYDTAKDNFVKAYLLADDGVAPKAPPTASRITWRHPMAPVSMERQKARPQWHMEMDAKNWIPDKAVLSSGNDAQGLWGMVELLPDGGHTGEIPGNIIALMYKDAALLAGQGYYENTPNFQNLLWIEDLDGLAADPRRMTTDIPAFVDDPAYTYLRLTTTAFQHLPVIYTRDIVFVKDGFMVIKDRVKFESTMKVRLGPCIQTRALGPQCGENWFNAYYDQLYYTGLGLGRGVQAIRNPAWDLLVYFSPRADRKHTVVDRYIENPYRCSPIQLRQSWSGMARAGQEITFTTVLLPHPPTLTPASLLNPPADSKAPKFIEVVRDDEAATVVKVVTQPDPTHEFYYEHWVLINNSGATVKAGALESNGQVAVARYNYNGNLQHRGLVGGTLLRIKEVDESAAARKLPVKPLEMPAALLK
ncbi:MAG: sugar-binding protein [Armatimonadota bacterium]